MGNLNPIVAKPFGRNRYRSLQPSHWGDLFVVADLTVGGCYASAVSCCAGHPSSSSEAFRLESFCNNGVNSDSVISFRPLLTEAVAQFLARCIQF